MDRYAAQKQGQHDLTKTSRIGMIGAAGDRRDDDMRELGHVAAQHFDVLVIREDERLRGRKAGRPPTSLPRAPSWRSGGRAVPSGRGGSRQLDATRHVLARTDPGDLVVMCVDQHAMVVAELEERTKHAQAGARIGLPSAATSDPDLDPTTMTTTAEARAPRPRARRSPSCPPTRTRPSTTRPSGSSWRSSRRR